jgi:hypothetical protein
MLANLKEGYLPDVDPVLVIQACITFFAVLAKGRSAVTTNISNALVVTDVFMDDVSVIALDWTVATILAVFANMFAACVACSTTAVITAIVIKVATIIGRSENLRVIIGFAAFRTLVAVVAEMFPADFAFTVLALFIVAIVVIVRASSDV